MVGLPVLLSLFSFASPMHSTLEKLSPAPTMAGVHGTKSSCMAQLWLYTGAEPINEGAQRAPRGKFNARREVSAQSLEEARSETGP